MEVLRFGGVRGGGGFTHGGMPKVSKAALVEGERAAVRSHCSLLLSRSNENTKGYCFFYE